MLKRLLRFSRLRRSSLRWRLSQASSVTVSTLTAYLTSTTCRMTLKCRPSAVATSEISRSIPKKTATTLITSGSALKRN